MVTKGGAGVRVRLFSGGLAVLVWDYGAQLEKTLMEVEIVETSDN